jgi:hypothetical protein
VSKLDDHAEASYQLAKLTSDAMKSTRDVLEAAGVTPETAELVLHCTYTLAWYDGAIKGVDLVRAG